MFVIFLCRSCEQVIKEVEVQMPPPMGERLGIVADNCYECWRKKVNEALDEFNQQKKLKNLFV